MRLYLIRHGETVWNKQRIIQGSGSDTELSETGKMQVGKLALSMKDVPFTAIYSSPMQRAMETAGAITGYHALDVQPEPDLREIHVGELEGMSLENFAKGFSQYLVDWQTKGEDLSFSGGERLGEFRDRVWSVVERIVKSNQGGAVALVSHYFVTATIVCTALGMPLTDLVRIRIQPSGRTILDFEDGCEPRLLLLSDVCHLREM
ncbi:MAG: histidine phosphatase family protein [Dehalococcoidia bacterium]